MRQARVGRVAWGDAASGSQDNQIAVEREGRLRAPFSRVPPGQPSKIVEEIPRSAREVLAIPAFDC